MKYISYVVRLIVVIALQGLTPAHAATKAYEGFEYADGNLNGQNGGIGFSGAWRNTTGSVVVSSTGSTYTKLDTGGGKVVLDPAQYANAVSFRNLTAAITDQNGGSTWLAFLGQRTNGSTGRRYLCVSLYSGTDTAEVLQVGHDYSAAGHWRLASGTASAVSAVNDDTLSLVAVRIDWNPSGPETVSLFVNPAVETEPTVPDATLSVEIGSFDRIRLGAGCVSGSAGECQGTFDEITIGDTYSDAVPPVLGWRNVAIGGGGNVLGVVADPTTQNMFYMKTDVGGAYRWDAANSKWHNITDGLPQTSGGQYDQIESIAVDPNNAGTVYISTGKSVSYAGEIWKSTNYGDTWTRANLKTTDFKVLGNVFAGKQLGERMMVDPNNSNVIYYATRADNGTRGDGLWKSTNASGTNSWAKVASFPVTGSDPEGLSFVAFDKNGGTTTVNSQVVSAIFYVGVYASGSSGTVYRTADGGQTWSPITGGLTTPTRAQVASDGTLYVAYGYGTAVGGVGKVARTGTSFTMVNPVTPVPASTGYAAIAVDPTNPQTVYVTEAKAAFYSITYQTTNGGNNWSVVTQPINNVNLIWTKGQGGIYNDATRPSSSWFGSVKATAINPFATSELWVSDWLGVVRTTNINATSPVWDYLYDGDEEVVVLDIKCAPQVSGSGAPMLSGIADVNGMRHTDLTVPPTSQYVDTGAASDGSTTALDFCEANPNVWARVFDDFASSGNGWLSVDNGQNWKPFGSKPYSNARGGRIAVSASNAQNFVWAPEGSVPYYTLNSGTTWAATSGLSGNFGPSEFSQGAKTLAADRVNGDFYALKSLTGSSQIYRSTNSGATWTLASTITYSSTSTVCSTYKIVAVPGIAGEVWVALDKVGVYRSTDGGTTFNVIPNVTSTGMVAFGKAKSGNSNPSVFFTGSLSGTSGIYRSDSLSSPSWTRIDNPTTPLGNLRYVIEGDRQIFGRVYIGTDGRGIYVGDSN